MNHAESALQKAVAQFLTLALPPTAWWTAIGHGGFALDAKTGARMKAMGVKAGVPDLLIIWDGHAGFIELKAAGGKLSPAQHVTRTALRNAGCYYGVENSVEGVDNRLRCWGIPLRASVGAQRAAA
jgi:hypothetical protein